MKKLILRIINALGYNLVKKEQVGIEKSTYSKELSFYETKTGKYYLPTDAKADAVANAIKEDRIFEREIVELAAKHIKKDTVVLDVGSNFGQMSILFADLVGPKGRVHAFDADDWIFEILNKNIAANKKENVIIAHF